MSDDINGLDAAYTTERVAFSGLSGDAQLALIGRIRRYTERNDGYPMTLNPTDASTIVSALCIAADESSDPDFADQCLNLVSSIAETLNIELT